jgi:hypothetical protein
VFNRRKKFKKGDKIQVIGRGGTAGVYYLKYGHVTKTGRGTVSVRIAGAEVTLGSDDVQCGK